jgi:putative toxin-antitoxin system antitoxin component (TIGR02293 family)
LWKITRWSGKVWCERWKRSRVHAGGVFANQEKALHWLQAPNPSLEGKTPLEAAQTEHGYQAVEDILGRIEYGVLG